MKLDWAAVDPQPAAAKPKDRVSGCSSVLPGGLWQKKVRLKTLSSVPVKNLFDCLEGTSSLEEFLEDFPSVSRERAVAVLEAARVRLAADAPASAASDGGATLRARRRAA